MKNVSKILILLLLILIACSANVVSATDMNSTDINQIDETLAIDEDDMLTTTEDSFTELNSIISNASSGDTIELNKNYTYNSTIDSDYAIGIVIDKSITVDGAGYTIDANNLARIFNVTAENVVIKNINFINGYYTDGYGQGSCVLWNSDNGELTNCNFTDSYAKIGGAVLWLGDDGLVNGCNFTSNSAMTTAGAIYWDGSNGIINNTYFGKNHVMTKGGALYSSYNDNITISNCIFDSNYASMYAGAIAFDYVTANIINTNFTGNYLQWSLNGGAIQLTGNSSNYCNITDCTFESNKAGTGTSIYSTIPISISDSTFSDSNNAKTIATTSDLTLNNNTLNNNTIYVNGGEIISPTTIKLNSSSLTVDVETNVTLSGKIYDDNNNTIILNAIDFIVNDDTVSATFTTDGTFTANYTITEDKNYTITVNTTGKLNDATINNLVIGNTSEDDITTTEGSFTELNSIISNASSGDTIELNKNYTYNSTIDSDYAIGIVIDKSITVDGAGYTIDANNLARIFNVTAENVVIKNINFINGYYTDGYGQGSCVLWNSDNGELTNCNFTDSYAKIGGAVLWLGDDGLVNGCNFTSNSAMTTAGAIYWDGSNGIINNTYFGKNHVMTKGGALYSSYNDNITISNCIFDSNYASMYAGAIAFDYVTANIINTNFTGNYLQWSLNGGAIQLTGNSSNYCNITDCTFESNKAGTGTSIYSTIPISISDSTFSDSNNAKTIATTSDLTLNNNTLNNNTIYVNGGEVISPTTIKLNSSSLTVDVETNVTLSGKIYDDNNNTIILNAIDFIVNDDTVSATFTTDGTFTANYTITEDKNYTITVNTTGKLNDATINNLTIISNTLIPEITIEVLYSTKPVAIIKVSSDVSGNYTVTVGEDIETIYLENSTVIVYSLDAGDYNITVSFDGDETYENTSKTLQFSIVEEKIDSTIIISDIVDFEIGKSYNVTISVGDATGNISVYYDGIPSNLVLENSSAVFVIDNITAGTHSIVAAYYGDDTHFSSINSTTFTAEVYSTKFDNLTVSSDFVITGVLVNSLGDAISNATINYGVGTISGNVTTASDGSFSISGANNAIISIGYDGSDIYEGSNITIKFDNISPSRDSTVILGNNYTQYAIEYSAGERGQNFTVQLVDIMGNPIANKTVLIGYNGKTLYRTTDESGYASVQINLKDKNRLTFAVTFLGDEDYNATMSVYLITINQKPVTITAAAKTYKVTAKTKSYTVTLKTIKGASADGNTYFAAGKKVTLKINGVTYTAKTTSAGKATFNIKITKRGVYTASISYAGDTTYSSVSKSVKITIK